MQLHLRKWKPALIPILMLLLIFTSVACTPMEEAVTQGTLGTESVQPSEENPIVEHTEGQSNEQNQGPGTYAPFWKVSHNGNTVYLLGSIHVAKSDLYPLHENIESAFAESQYLAVEVDLVNADLLKLQTDMMNKARYKDGTTLKHHIPPYEYTKLKNKFKEYKMNIKMFEAYKPWFVASLLETMVYSDLGYDSKYGVDQHFLELAQGNKEIIELETVDFQIGIMDEFSDELQLEQLKGVLRSKDTQYEEFEQLFTAWKSGNSDDLSALVEGPDDPNADQELVDEFNKIMLDDRNIGMVDKIEGFLKGSKQETYFVVVGAAHYVGEMGIVKLLENRGYTVVQEEWSE